MKKKKARTKQMQRFLRWINTYPGWWRLICTPGDSHVNDQLMRTIIKKLAEDELYEMIFVMLNVHRAESYVMSGLESSVLQLMMEEWDRNGKIFVGHILESLE